MEPNNNFDSFAASPNAVSNLNDAELSWDATIESDAPEYVLLPEGDYTFAVESYERTRYAGGDKVPACPQLIVHLLVIGEDGTSMANIRHSFFMLASKAHFLGSFLTCLGLKKPGEAIQLDVNKLPARTGRAHVVVREYNGKQYNNISKFLKPDQAAAATPNNQQAVFNGFQGKF